MRAAIRPLALRRERRNPPARGQPGSGCARGAAPRAHTRCTRKKGGPPRAGADHRHLPDTKKEGGRDTPARGGLTATRQNLAAAPLGRPRAGTANYARHQYGRSFRRPWPLLRPLPPRPTHPAPPWHVKEAQIFAIRTYVRYVQTHLDSYTYTGLYLITVGVDSGTSRLRRGVGHG